MYRSEGEKLVKVWETQTILYETHRRLDWPDETIRSLIITSADPKTGVYEGRIDCEDHSPHAGPFELGWRARVTEDGYEIMPTDRSGIDFPGMLTDERFTHSREFDEKLREYIEEELRKSGLA